MKTLIIAEAGVNHNGSFEIAKQLVDKFSVAFHFMPLFKLGSENKYHLYYDTTKANLQERLQTFNYTNIEKSL